MITLNEFLEKNILDIIQYEKENAIEIIVKTFFETILKLERSQYLESYNENAESFTNKANGYYERFIKCINQYLKLKIPRDRLGLFKPVFLDALKEKEQEMADLAFKLYTKGLTTRDISDIFNEVYDKPMSATSVSNITAEFESIRINWQGKKLEEEYYFVYIDALYCNVRRDTVQKEAFYIVLGLKKNLKREVLGVYNIPTETAFGWEEALKDLKNRGLKKVLMFIADGLSGLENVIAKEYPDSDFQKCLIHKVRNVMSKVRSDHKKEIASDFLEVFKLEDANYKLSDGLKKLNWFILKWGKNYPSIKNMFKDEHINNYFAYLNYPPQIQRMIYTTNWLERLNKGIRRTEKIRNSFPSPDSALNLICAYLMDFEERVYKYPVTAFIKVQDILNNKF